MADDDDDDDDDDSTKIDKISCEIKKLVVLWPDPSFLYKNV